VLHPLPKWPSSRRDWYWEWTHAIHRR